MLSFLAKTLVPTSFLGILFISGFGFSAIFIASATLLTNPLPLIPVVFLCEMLMTTAQVNSIRGHIAWGRVAVLLAGAALVIAGNVLVIWREHRLGLRRGKAKPLIDPKGG